MFLVLFQPTLSELCTVHTWRALGRIRKTRHKGILAIACSCSCCVPSRRPFEELAPDGQCTQTRRALQSLNQTVKKSIEFHYYFMGNGGRCWDSTGFCFRGSDPLLQRNPCYLLYQEWSSALKRTALRS
ncbi:hypothetical protein BDN72DRAFT_175421 [Pluteus cervinus]|uniref:Uncharacterized protein n=1 Tax=Pluteus cervinus TaxID=181527 RepID=A0ACD3AJS8_9AGAR|nr:hypothetical protein BDN72DRAFT_175421 [Pluteus cervinus]